MGKVYAIYGAALCCLFCALIVVFWAMGLGQGPPPAPPELTQESEEITVDERIDENLKKHSAFASIFATLFENVAYVSPHDIILYTNAEEDLHLQETLPTGGIFLVDRFQTTDEKGWYQVTVNNGVRNYSMYIKQDDIDPFNPSVYGAPPTEKQIQEREGLHRFIREISRDGTERAIERERMAEIEDQPDDLERLTASIRDLSRNVNSRGLFLPIAVAAGFTLFFTFAMAFAIWFKQAHSFGSEYTIDELYHHEDEEVYDRSHEDDLAGNVDEDVYGREHRDDPMDNSDYDLPKSPFD